MNQCYPGWREVLTPTCIIELLKCHIKDSVTKMTGKREQPDALNFLWNIPQELGQPIIHQIYDIAEELHPMEVGEKKNNKILDRVIALLENDLDKINTEIERVKSITKGLAFSHDEKRKEQLESYLQYLVFARVS